MARSWAREPLVHFLLAGAAIFAVTALWPSGQDTHTIGLDRRQLTEYMLARAEITDRGQFDQTWRDMSAGQRADLIRRAARDEALYREGLAIGLDRADPLIRQRIVQQMGQLFGDEAASQIQLTDADLTAFYRAHQDQYRQPATVSFAHVFFKSGNDGERARQRAQAELGRLRAGHVAPADAATHGERFLYETFLRDAGPDDITAKFGTEFATAVFALPPGQWEGPLRSEHGWHLVRVTAQTPEHVLTMEALGPRLREDALAARQQQTVNAAYQRLLDDYHIETAADLTP
jgi:parvulin-like peptidyl-prolyl isomerase